MSYILTPAGKKPLIMEAFGDLDVTKPNVGNWYKKGDAYFKGERHRNIKLNVGNGKAREANAIDGAVAHHDPKSGKILVNGSTHTIHDGATAGDNISGIEHAQGWKRIKHNDVPEKIKNHDRFK